MAAEALMEERPDSALVLLQGMDTAAIAGDRAATFEQFVNEHYENVMAELKCDLPNLKEDIPLFMYCTLGFSANAITFLLQMG